MDVWQRFDQVFRGLFPVCFVIGKSFVAKSRCHGIECDADMRGALVPDYLEQ